MLAIITVVLIILPTPTNDYTNDYTDDDDDDDDDDDADDDDYDVNDDDHTTSCAPQDGVRDLMGFGSCLQPMM